MGGLSIGVQALFSPSPLHLYPAPHQHLSTGGDISGPRSGTFIFVMLSFSIRGVNWSVDRMKEALRYIVVALDHAVLLLRCPSFPVILLTSFARRDRHRNGSAIGNSSGRLPRPQRLGRVPGAVPSPWSDSSMRRPGSPPRTVHQRRRHSPRRP